MSTTTDSLATKQEIADRYGVHPRKIQELVDDGIIPAYQLGPRILRFDIAEVDNALRQGAGNETR